MSLSEKKINRLRGKRPEELADFIVSHRVQEEPHVFVCYYEHEASRMLHFDGEDAAKIVAPVFGMSPPPSQVNPDAAFGSMAISQEFLKLVAKPKNLEFVSVESLPYLKRVQELVDSLMTKHRLQPDPLDLDVHIATQGSNIEAMRVVRDRDGP